MRCQINVPENIYIHEGGISAYGLTGYEKLSYEKKGNSLFVDADENKAGLIVVYNDKKNDYVGAYPIVPIINIAI
jgi:hypothetical protein